MNIFLLILTVSYFYKSYALYEEKKNFDVVNGTVAHDNGEVSEDRQYKKTPFNVNNNDNMYVGYMYTSGDAHGLGTSSTIKTANDQFYQDKLLSYASKIDTTVGFCGDRSTLNLQSGVGTGTVTTYTKSYLRVEESTPSLSCENEKDYYTVSSSSLGNKALIYPIGLVAADEVMLAGHAGGIFDGTYNHQISNQESYLTTGSPFWTMAPTGGYNPYGVTSWYTNAFFVGNTDGIGDGSIGGTHAIRRVINIRFDVSIRENGTKNEPYEIL